MRSQGLQKHFSQAVATTKVATQGSSTRKTTLASKLASQIRKLEGLSLGFLGEDSGGMVVTRARSGPLKNFTDGEILSKMGYHDIDKVKSNDHYNFHEWSKTDSELWDALGDSALTPASAQQLKKLLTHPAVKNIATMVTDDHHEGGFGYYGNLIARLKDNSFVVLRDQIGSM